MKIDVVLPDHKCLQYTENNKAQKSQQTNCYGTNDKKLSLYNRNNGQLFTNPYIHTVHIY